MSDQNSQLRDICSGCFARVLKIYPLSLDSSRALLPKDLEERKKCQVDFIEQLLDRKKVPRIELPFKANFELRNYQLEGVSWLWFLNRFNLNGILCDGLVSSYALIFSSFIFFFVC